MRDLTPGGTSRGIGDTVLQAERTVGAACARWLDRIVSNHPFVAVPADYR